MCTSPINAPVITANSQPSIITHHSSPINMFCLGARDKAQPIRLPDESDSDRLLDEIYALDEKNIAPLAPSEDEMQARLKDLRKAIADANLDW
jgi:hypothetical protein